MSPVYDWRCGGCGSVRSEIRCIADRDKPVKCDVCKDKIPMTREPSPTRGIVKNPAVPKRIKR